jgi:hypothetical protein
MVVVVFVFVVLAMKKSNPLSAARHDDDEGDDDNRIHCPTASTFQLAVRAAKGTFQLSYRYLLFIKTSRGTSIVRQS